MNLQPSVLPYLTADLPGIGGRIRERLEDFRVEEIPLYDPCGEGTHVYFRVAKEGVATQVAVGRIARYMGVRPAEIGLAGLKDAAAVTSQMMSLEHADPDKLAAYGDSQVRVTWTGRHANKLRMGHLAGNRFTIRIRQAGPEHLAGARRILDVLAARGVPNYFGPQRFGLRGDTAELGRALVKEDLDRFVALYLGRSRPDDPPDCRAARDAFDAGFLDRAIQCWPRHYGDERRALAAYKKKRRPAQALAAIDKRMRGFYVSAFQSLMFNEVLAGRIGAIDRLMWGDLAQKHDSGGIFTVEDAAAEQLRADAFEISPTGPIVGYRSSLASGEPGKMEKAVLDEQAVSQDDFRRTATLKVKGGRRPLRARLEAPSLAAGMDDHGSFIELSFAAPSGCYATVVLREIIKAGE